MYHCNDSLSRSAIFKLALFVDLFLTSILFAQNNISTPDSFSVEILSPELGITSSQPIRKANELITHTTDIPLEPEPTAAGAAAFFGGSPGHFVIRSCDLFFDDNTDFNQQIAITSEPVKLRALFPYDMDLDPLYDGGQKLTRANTQSELNLLGGSTTTKDNLPGDPVLFVNLASFYDDNEADGTGGFWANWKIYVTPVVFVNGSWQKDYATFLTKFRGPFWSGEKLEVGDTEGSFLPQIMHYQNFGIWNWNWSSHEAVEVHVEEGDGGFFDDQIAHIIVRKDESMNGTIILGDTGHIVELYLTNDNRFKRVVVDNSGIDPDGRPRILSNPDNHDVDISFRTSLLTNTISSSNRYFIGPNRVKGSYGNETFEWKEEINLGTKVLRYIDNVNYTPGWDCEDWWDPNFDPYDVDDDFEFFIYPNNSNVNAITDRGGCDNTTTLFFRSTLVNLPDFVIIRYTPGDRIIVSNGTSNTFTFPKTPGYTGIIFTELLAYQTNGDDDLGFKIEKSSNATDYIVSASAFDGNANSSIHFKATVIEWPLIENYYINNVHMSTQAAINGTAHGIVDVPISRPDLPYFVINEILTYDPDTDDDMSWSLYFEPLQAHINFQLASGNTSNSGAYVEADAYVIQFRPQGMIAQTYVDGSNNGFENGTPEFPWNTVQEGVNWISAGGNIWITPATYPENITINKACNLFRNGNSGIVIIGQ